MNEIEVESAWLESEQHAGTFGDFLQDRDHRFLVLKGGRSSGKSYAAALIILIRGVETPDLRVMVAREVIESITKSVWPLVLDLNLTYGFGFQRKGARSIVHPNGSSIDMHGLSESTGTARSIRSAHDYDLCYVEEGQFITESSWLTAEPTIRKEGSQILITMNPRFRSDPLSVLYESGLDDVRCEHVNYNHNRFLSATALKSIAKFRERYGEAAYRHHYLGGYADDDSIPRVLAPREIEAAFAAWETVEPEGRVHAGWDVADQGLDMNALVFRRGPAVFHVERWSGQGKTLAHSAERVVAACIEWHAAKLFVDAGGMGAGARSDLERIAPPFEWRMINAGGAVGGKDVIYQSSERNRDRFMNRYAQLAWALKLRAEASKRLAAGEGDVPHGETLAFHPDLRRRFGADWELHLLQPLWSETSVGKLRIDKQPDSTDASPDLFDAAALAFADDSRNGLTIGLSPLDAWRQARRARLGR